MRIRAWIDRHLRPEKSATDAVREQLATTFANANRRLDLILVRLECEPMPHDVAPSKMKGPP